MLRGGAWIFPKTWSVAWGDKEVPYGGRDRRQLEGFTLPPAPASQEGRVVRIGSKDFSACVHLDGAFIDWQSHGMSVLAERRTDAYGLGADGSLWHAHELRPGVAFHGLGEASGPLDRRGRRFEMRNIDAMGYDAERTDPLYKHYPFLIHREGPRAVGIFYDNFSTGVFNLGQEIDNYHGPFFSYRASGGDLDFYVILGPDVAGVTELFTRLTGRPCLTPEWALGYSGSTMTYTDAPDAQKQLMGFLDKLEEHRLPCASFHLSSGYTSMGKRRYVFTWNRDKIPDPSKLVADFLAKGVRLIPNIKPVLLTDHPKYAEAAARGLFVLDAEKDVPELSQFWDGLGSHLDFTNASTVAWWQENIRDQLAVHGIDAAWNDNNEFQVWQEGARTAGGWPVGLGRPIQTLLMAKASSEMVSFVVSRSGMPGMQRHVQTWSGDNTTAWKTLRYNLAQALNLSLSGMSNTGHDVGGFAGPRPSPELFLRWIQHAIFYPRFVIHSWKPEGVNEPWMYPELVPQIRSLYALRERLAPYFRRLQRDAHENFRPFLRPLMHDFPQDAVAAVIDDQFLVGPALLVANVFEEGARARKVYLPDCPGGWVNFWDGKVVQSGWLDCRVTRDTWPMFRRVGEEL